MPSKSGMKGKTLNHKARSLPFIKRIWGDSVVIDAKKDLRLIPLPEDVATAKKSDPSHCIFANTCRRVLHCNRVLIFRTVAYVEVPRIGKEPIIERFYLNDAARDLIDRFDKDKGLSGDTEFVLRAPPPARTLNNRIKYEAKTGQSQKRKSRRPRRAALVGESIGQGKGAMRDDPLLIDANRRVGAGMVHFRKDIKRIVDG